MIICQRCKQSKIETCFTFRFDRQVYRQPCKKCRCEQERNRRTPRVNTLQYHSFISRKYKLSKHEYEKLLFLQDYSCAICKNLFDFNNTKQINIDHDHLTLKVRGILCGPCNKALGHFKDSIENLKAATNYLEFYRALI